MLRIPLARTARVATARPIATLLVFGALALVAAALALRLTPSASTDTLVGHSSESARATESLRRQFGDDAVVVLVQGDLQRTVLTSDLARLIRLEGCLSGNVPRQGLALLPATCSQLARLHPAKVVYGPGTFINASAQRLRAGLDQERATTNTSAMAAAQSAQALAAARHYPKRRQQQLASSAYNYVYSQFTRRLIQTSLRYGLTSLPSVDSPSFVSQLVFDTGAGGPNIPKARFAYLFPNSRAGLILIRMRPNLSDGERRRAIALFKQAVREPAFSLQAGQRFIVSGVPVVVVSLADAVQHSIFILLAAALILMALTLTLVFRTNRRLRLLPLGIALAAAAMTYGCVSLFGLSLTMASIAALPVLIGLAVDYAIQLQARFDEARAGGERPRTAALGAASGAATLAGAAVATAAGFLVLLLSPIPMVHGFALLVILGIGLAFACALTAGLAALTQFSDRPARPLDLPPALPRLRARLITLRARVGGHRLGSDPRAASTLIAVTFALVVVAALSSVLAVRLGALLSALIAGGLLALMGPARARIAAWSLRLAQRTLWRTVSDPRRVLTAALAIAALGWIADTQTAVVSDVRQLVPQSLGALKDVSTLERATGVSGEVDVMVRSRDLTDPAVINWMADYQGHVLARHGYRTGSTCTQRVRPPQLCPALSLTDFFRTPPKQAADVSSLIAAVPPYFSQAVISPDRRIANLAFGIRLMPLDQQKRVIDDMRSSLHPPPGVTAAVAGLPVLAAEANGKLASEWRRMLTLLAGLAAVFLVLLAIRRRLSAALVPLIPIALATGWSALVLFVLGIPLNPMSAMLGALVIAISTEFSVLLSARYAQERENGAGTERALELAYASTGSAVLASGITAIVGFGALMASDISMLRDFGAVTAVDLTVSLVGVLIVLPAALVWSERRAPLELRDVRSALRRTLGRNLSSRRSAGPPALKAEDAQPRRRLRVQRRRSRV
ncbi:MAG: hypothetical protein NVSMB25_20560 [Thermoleophilaceae bacterium]